MHWHPFYAFGLAKASMSPWSTAQLDMNLGKKVCLVSGGYTACQSNLRQTTSKAGERRNVFAAYSISRDAADTELLT